VNANTTSTTTTTAKKSLDLFSLPFASQHPNYQPTQQLRLTPPHKKEKKEGFIYMKGGRGQAMCASHPILGRDLFFPLHPHNNTTQHSNNCQGI